MADLTLAMAERAVSAAQARELGTPITVTVVDEAGPRSPPDSCCPARVPCPSARTAA